MSTSTEDRPSALKSALGLLAAIVVIGFLAIFSWNVILEVLSSISSDRAPSLITAIANTFRMVGGGRSQSPLIFAPPPYPESAPLQAPARQGVTCAVPTYASDGHYWLAGVPYDIAPPNNPNDLLCGNGQKAKWFPGKREEACGIPVPLNNGHYRLEGVEYVMVSPSSPGGVLCGDGQHARWR